LAVGVSGELAHRTYDIRHVATGVLSAKMNADTVDFRFRSARHLMRRSHDPYRDIAEEIGGQKSDRDPKAP
jgi:hypothetical protein